MTVKFNKFVDAFNAVDSIFKKIGFSLSKTSENPFKCLFFLIFVLLDLSVSVHALMFQTAELFVKIQHSWVIALITQVLFKGINWKIYASEVHRLTNWFHDSYSAEMSPEYQTIVDKQQVQSIRRINQATL